MNNAELHERTIEVLTTLVPVLNCEDLALICWHCGIQPQELMPVERPNYRIFPLFNVPDALGKLTIRKGNQDERTA